ncbi:aspartate/glutamate racemase family protein [Ensifer sp. ENS05]|uniref:aspartate/glutamate racemase family protein n=1 Tax=Ensifer sp. ENS05 TaxID=2769277 RepID=UPI00177E7417|nr:aspartate/glutamate racemase family protein [Ensifer sp. ENS05]MBD9597329.1 aspartate/glutamate racemase family protein [Ensifer sp. ENS05]
MDSLQTYNPANSVHSPVHGVSIGVIVLDTRFQRIPGDIGNATTFPFPVQYMIANGLREGSSLEPDPVTLKNFVDVANQLIALGVSGITTSCGFLSLFQDLLAERLSVPVATSSLLQIPLVQRLLPKGKRVGVLTATHGKLTPAHFKAVGAPEDTPFDGLEMEGTFRQNLRHGVSPIRYADHEADILDAARRLLQKNSEIGAIVLECTNMPPYAHAISARYGLPVFDVISMIKWFHQGLVPRAYA